jgi:hypothetical protein
MTRVIALGFCVLGAVVSMAAQGPALAGKWRVAGPGGAEWLLVLGADGTAEVLGGGQSRVKGRYTIKDGVFTITDESGEIACLAEATATGTYKYKLEGAQLALEAIKDECPGRRGALSTKPLQKAQ